MSQIETLLDEGDDDDWKSILTLFRMGGGGRTKKPPTSFSPVTSTDVGTSPPKFLTFSSNPFPTLV